jgi:hypothetical protein
MHIGMPLKTGDWFGANGFFLVKKPKILSMLCKVVAQTAHRAKTGYIL